MRLSLLVTIGTLAVGCGDNATLTNVVTGQADFGLTDCGNTGVPQVVVVANPGGATFAFTTSLGSGSASLYTVSPPSGVLLPNNEIELTIYSKPMPAVSPTTADLYGDTLTITTSLKSDKPHSVPISQTAHGAILQLSAPTLDFSTPTPVGAAAQTMPLTIENMGNSDTTVTVPTGNSFTLSPTGTQTVAAGSSLATTVSYTPLAVGPISEKLALQATGPQCGPLPSFTATATGTLTGTAKAIAMSTAHGRPKSGGLTTLCAIVSGGYVACTGQNTFGQRGAGAGAATLPTFNLVVTNSGTVLDQVTHLDGGRNRFCVLRQPGDIWCWGDTAALGASGGRGGVIGQASPAAIQVTGAGNLAVATNYGFTCLVNSGGTVSCTAPQSQNSADIAVWTATGATAVSTNAGGGLALTDSGTVMSFGLNVTGERGTTNGGSAVSSNDPASTVDGLTNIIQVSAGGTTSNRTNSHHSCAVDNLGNAWCWGRNRHGELGNGTVSGSRTTATTTPGTVMTAVDAPLTGVTQVSAGNAHSCAVAAGNVYCWGRGSEGELGIPVCTATITTGCANENNGFAVQVPGVTNAVSVVARMQGTCAVLSSGGVTCWGNAPGVASSTPTSIAAFGP